MAAPSENYSLVAETDIDRKVVSLAFGPPGSDVVVANFSSSKVDAALISADEGYLGLPHFNFPESTQRVHMAVDKLDEDAILLSAYRDYLGDSIFAFLNMNGESRDEVRLKGSVDWINSGIGYGTIGLEGVSEDAGVTLFDIGRGTVTPVSRITTQFNPDEYNYISNGVIIGDRQAFLSTSQAFCQVDFRSNTLIVIRHDAFGPGTIVGDVAYFADHQEAWDSHNPDRLIFTQLSSKGWSVRAGKRSTLGGHEEVGRVLPNRDSLIVQVNSYSKCLRSLSHEFFTVDLSAHQVTHNAELSFSPPREPGVIPYWDFFSSHGTVVAVNMLNGSCYQIGL